MRISILTNDIAHNRAVIAEHGLCLYIEHEGTSILFDTGQSDAYCKSAAVLGIDLKKTDFIALSHGHYDHCGGLAHFPECGSMPKIYAHPKSFNKRYHKKGQDGKYEEIGIPWRPDDKPSIRDSIIFNVGALKPYPGIHLITETPRTTDFEKLPEDFFMEESGDIVPDTFTDEQMLVVETGKGLVCVLGCSHPGIINCLNHVKSTFPDKTIHAVIAGMHMDKASGGRIEATIKAMHELGVTIVIPLHCTGIGAVREIKKSFQDRCLTLAAGDSVEF